MVIAEHLLDVDGGLSPMVDRRVGEDGFVVQQVALSVETHHQALGIFLPLITTNCAVLGVAILVIQKDYNLLQSVVYAFSTAIGFGLALTVFAGMREQLELVKIPKGMQGMAIVMLSAGLLSLAFMKLTRRQWKIMNVCSKEKSRAATLLLLLSLAPNS